MARDLFIDTDFRAFVRSYKDTSRIGATDLINQDKEPYNIYFLERTGVQGRPYSFLDKSAASLKIGVGNKKAPLTAGTFAITFGADTTAGIPIGSAASVVSAALNGLASVISAGGVTVTKAANANRYRVTFVANGARAAFTIDTTEVIPAATGAVSERIPGSASVQEVQEIALFAAPVAYQDSFSDLPSAVTPSVTTIQSGSSSQSEIQKIEFSPAGVGGTFAITIPADTRSVTAAVVAGVFTTTENHGFALNQPIIPTGFTNEANFTEGQIYYVKTTPSPTTFTISATSGGSAITTATADAGSGTITTIARTTGEISYDAQPATVQAALEALDCIGTGGVSVGGVVSENYVLSFAGQKANANFPAVAVSAGNLSAPYGKTGVLDLATFGLQDLFDAQEEPTLDTTFEVELTEGSNRSTFQATATISEDIIKGASFSEPIPDAFANLHAYDTGVLDSSTDILLSKLAPETKLQTLAVTVDADVSPYTGIIALDVTDCRAGDITLLSLYWPNSSNPTVEIRNASVGGSVLSTQAAPGSLNTQKIFFTFNGTTWE